MNTQYCIWHFSPTEILDASKLELKDFDDSSILDVGCGFSDLLSFIWENSTPQRLVGVDPIFSTPIILESARRNTLSYVCDLMKSYVGTAWTQDKLAMRKEVLENFSPKKNNIEYYSNISKLETESFDYIFINFVLAHIREFQARIDLVQNMRKYKIQIWKIIVIDVGYVLHDIAKHIWNVDIHNVNRSVSCVRI